MIFAFPLYLSSVNSFILSYLVTFFVTGLCNFTYPFSCLSHTQA
uniref:Uncharacterized protein n=1 Tax=Arundo donax TaxID=35708 RepID=A0A0A9C142_ARUDO